VDDSIVTSFRSNQIEINFSQAFSASLITNTVDALSVGSPAGPSGSAVQANGCATYSTGANAGGFARGVTVQAFSYRPGHELYCYFTASWTPGVAGSHQRIGPFNGAAGTPQDGFSLGYEGTVWGISQWRGGTLVGGTANVTPTVPLASFNGDKCSGSNSAYTLNGVPVAMDFTKINIFRIHGSWFGAAPITLEAFSPDGEWTVMNTFQYPNSLTVPYATSTNWNIQVDVTNTTNATNLAIVTPCWGMGATDAALPLNSTLTNQSLATTTRTVLTGYYATAQAYMNVGTDSQGSLFTDINGIGGTGVVIASPGIILAGIADGSGNKLTSNSTTYTAKHGLDINVLGTLGTAFSTAGQVDVKIAADSYVPTLHATNQVTVDSTGELIIASNTSRQAVLITNTSETITVFIGASGVTATTGAALLPNSSITIPATSAFYGIVTVASPPVTAVVTYMELQ